MKTSKCMSLFLGCLMVTILITTAGAGQTHVDKTITSISTSKAVSVTWKNFVRAESDKMFKSYVDMGAFGKFLHIPKPTPSISKRWFV